MKGNVESWNTNLGFWLLGIWFLAPLFLVSCSSEFNLATQRQETLMYDSAKEERIGAAAALSIEAHYDVLTEVDLNERAQAILDRLVAVSDRKELVYTLRILDKDMINAVSLPGGYIYLFKGLMDKVENDDQLAGVIAHEMAHITARHSVKRIQAAYGAMALQIASMATNANVAAGTNLALNSIFAEYSQADEFEADELGLRYMTRAGYDPLQMVAVLRILQTESTKEIHQYSYFRTHPYIGKRISNINSKVEGAMQFNDYLNLTGD